MSSVHPEAQRLKAHGLVRSDADAGSVAWRSGSNFYFSFFSLPKRQRQAITAVYAFCREVDDAVDDPGAHNPVALVAEWRQELARTYEGHPGFALTRSLLQAIER